MKTWLRAWLLPGLAIGGVVALALAGDTGRSWLRYDRTAIGDGQLWRLISGHFVHLGWSHLLLNAAGLALVSYLVAARFSPARWLAIAVLTVAGIDAGFWWLEPQLEWYVGLSGLLHGLLAAGIVAGLRLRYREAWLLGVLVAAKLLYEQLVGPLPGSAASSGGTVVVAAHLYGALTGAAVGALLPIRVQPKAPI
ncbi:MAG: rhombosortase [Gammaproteobacteria bacterium]|nr:rhombosortase [Gammaproteobacteria bacterium]